MNRPFLPSEIKQADPLRDWQRYVTAKAVAGISKRTIPDVAKQFYGDNTEAVLKAAVGPAMTTDWGGNLAGTRVGSFLQSLRPKSAAAQLLERSPRFDLTGVNSITFPRFSTDFPAPAWVGEGGAIPVFRGSLVTSLLGPPKKLAAMAGLTQELATLSAEDAEQIISAVMQDAAAKALDASMFSNAAASAVRPAGILNGVTAITGTAGGGQAALLADLKAIAAGMSGAGLGGDFLLFMNPVHAVTLGVLATGPQSFEVIQTPALAAGTIIAVHPAAFASGFGAEPEVQIADNAVIHYDDAAAQISTDGTVPAPVRSSFQTDTHVLRLILKATWLVRQPGAVQFITGATW